MDAVQDAPKRGHPYFCPLLLLLRGKDDCTNVRAIGGAPFPTSGMPLVQEAPSLLSVGLSILTSGNIII